MFHGVLYLIAGVLLLVGRYVPVALVILGPIIVNILVFHLTLAASGIGPGLVCSLLEIFLIWAYWPAFRGIFIAEDGGLVEASHESFRSLLKGSWNSDRRSDFPLR